jgi:hypothetical protein
VAAAFLRDDAFQAESADPLPQGFAICEAGSRRPIVAIKHQVFEQLLRSSAAYAIAKLNFANAIVIAQRAGETDEEIAHVTGYTVP